MYAHSKWIRSATHPASATHVRPGETYARVTTAHATTRKHTITHSINQSIAAAVQKKRGRMTLLGERDIPDLQKEAINPRRRHNHLHKLLSPVLAKPGRLGCLAVANGHRPSNHVSELLEAS